MNNLDKLFEYGHILALMNNDEEQDFINHFCVKESVETEIKQLMIIIKNLKNKNLTSSERKKYKEYKKKRWELTNQRKQCIYMINDLKEKYIL